MTMTLADRLLTCDDLAAMIDSGVQPTVLDVRTAAEFETAKIADSVNIPLDQLHGCAADIARTKTPIVRRASRVGVRPKPSSCSLHTAQTSRCSTAAWTLGNHQQLR